MNMEEKQEIQASWKCSNCGYALDAPAPPEQCPSCKQFCEFVNVTCYTPDCGGPDSGTTDDRLGKKTIK